MQKFILKIDGMMCGMCESHINDAVRKARPVKKVKSSHAKGLTEVWTEEDVSEQEWKSIIDATGYTLVSVTQKDCDKKKLFHRG